VTDVANLTVDPEDLTLDEVEEVEETLGVSIDQAFAEGRPKAKALKVVLWVILRRDQPELTLDEVGAMKIKGLMGPGGA
jgi:hypothetical protein